MKIIEASSKVVQCKQMSGLFMCQMEHEVKSTKANLDWNGPKIGSSLWHSILSFFKWSYDKTRSETQVRLYVNPKVGTWGAWAYPQICGTGMTTREIQDSTQEFASQRAKFADSDGWIPFGTVHHHCSMSAFQSGTDKDNEQNQDGLHITVGKLDEKKYDIHARFYLSGCKFTPDLSEMWDIGEVMNEVPEWARLLLPPDTEHKIAEDQMRTPPPLIYFPKEWEANLVEEKRPEITPVHYNPTIGGLGLSYAELSELNGGSGVGSFVSQYDLSRAIRMLIHSLQVEDENDLYRELEWMFNSQENSFSDVVNILYQCELTPEEVMDELGSRINRHDSAKEAKELASENDGIDPNKDYMIQ